MQELALILNKTTNSKIVETKFRENFVSTIFDFVVLLARPSTKTDYFAEVVH